MSVNRTFTVTVVSTGSGNKYFIDGVQTPTLELVEGATFRFDQSDSTNGSHPLRFATAADAAGGTEYTTNVTTNGTPGSSGAYTQIEVASSAPTLYYYCTNHGGMGGQANTPNSDFWGAGNWSANLWGIEEAFALGWGAQAWNDGEWGSLNDVTFTLTGLSSTSTIGSPTISTEINTGWGQDGWGVENWGQSGITVELTGVEATTGIGEDVSWGKQTWGSSTTGWGGEYYLNVASVLGLTGVSATSSVGTPTAISDLTLTPTGQSATSSVGTPSIDFSIIVSPTGLSMTSSVGTIDPADQVMGLTGLSATSAVGSLTIASNPVIDVTGLSMTSSAGVLTPADVMGLTGVSATASTGSLAPADVMGLTGVSATASVSPIGVAPLGYERVTATQTANYTSVNAGN
jgi:hypothetical protein